jgi:predicted ATP-grasp superfamily ATP-dependent carboligase
MAGTFKKSPKIPIIVVGFNSRPIAEACWHAGLDPVVVDFFGDEDTREFVSEGHFYLESVATSPEAPDFKAWAVDTVESVSARACAGGEEPWVLVGSGFDDEFDCWERFSAAGHLLGNAPASIGFTRDFERIRQIVLENGIPITFPKTMQVDKAGERDILAIVDHATLELGFPLLVKKKHSAGGAGVEIAEDGGSLETLLRNAIVAGDASFSVQEYISGQTTDASVLAIDGDVICFTRQLIGTPWLGAPRPFSYCGNIVPLENVDAGIRDAMGDLVGLLHEQAGLRGLYGVDIIIKDGQAWFMEVNPRIPGSMEPASLALDRNLVVEHILACGFPRVAIHQDKPTPPANLPGRTAVKCIMFAEKDFTMPSIGDLQPNVSLHDITPPGTPIAKGVPVLTAIVAIPPCDDEAAQGAAKEAIVRIQQALFGREEIDSIK